MMITAHIARDRVIRNKNSSMVIISDIDIDSRMILSSFRVPLTNALIFMPFVNEMTRNLICGENVTRFNFTFHCFLSCIF